MQKTLRNRQILLISIGFAEVTPRDVKIGFYIESGRSHVVIVLSWNSTKGGHHEQDLNDDCIGIGHLALEHEPTR